MRVEVLNGVNLNMLGRRDPAVYGTTTIAELESRIYDWGRALELSVNCRQTNDEGALVVTDGPPDQRRDRLITETTHRAGGRLTRCETTSTRSRSGDCERGPECGYRNPGSRRSLQNACPMSSRPPTSAPLSTS